MNKIGDIQLFAEINRGEHGATYRGLDLTSQQLVLVKTFKANKGEVNGDAPTSRFQREAAAYATIQHANVVKLLHYGTVGDVRYLALEFIDGPTLRALLQRVSPSNGLPWEIAVAVFCDVLAGVEEIHRRHFIHRDLKPENILIGSNGEVKICDFDLAISGPAAGDSGSIERLDRGLAEAGLTGSSGYTAPETILGEKPTSASDIFSLGIVLYEMLAGARPFQGLSARGEMTSIVKLPHVALGAINPALPACFDELIDRLLAKKPRERMSVIDEVMSWLQKKIVIGDHEARREMLRQYLSDPQTHRPVILLRAPEKNANPSNQTKVLVRRRIAAAMLSVGLMVAGFMAWSNHRGNETDFPRRDDQANAASNRQRIAEANTSQQLNDSLKVPVAGISSSKKPTFDFEINAVKSIEPSIPAKPKTFLVVIDSNPWAFVLIDNDSIGQTPLSAPFSMREGDHELIFKNPRLPPVRVTATIDSTTPGTMTFSLWDYIAQLEVHITPWAEMFVNGQRRELPPGDKVLMLTPGKYSFRFVHPQLGEKNETLFLRAGESRKLAMNMF